MGGPQRPKSGRAAARPAQQLPPPMASIMTKLALSLHKGLLVPAIEILPSLASKVLKKEWKSQTICSRIFLMWSESVSVRPINLQTLKSMLKSAQKCAILFQSSKMFWERARPPPADPTLFVSPQFAPSNQCLWINRHYLFQYKESKNACCKISDITENRTCEFFIASRKTASQRAPAYIVNNMQ